MLQSLRAPGNRTLNYIMKKINFWIVLITGISVLIGACATDDDSSTASTASTLSAPSGVTANLGYYEVALDWTAVSGASSYTVYWGSSTGISSSSTAITGITDDNYTHTGLDNGTNYFYKVATVNSAGTGSLSSEDNATPPHSSSRYSKATIPVAQSSIATKQLPLAWSDPMGRDLIVSKRI